MQRLEMKEFKVKGQERPVKYKELIENVIFFPGEKGVTAEAARLRFRVVDAIEKMGVSNHLDLEDADAETLKSLVENMIWGVVDRGILQFCDDVKDMKTVEPKTKSK